MLRRSVLGGLLGGIAAGSGVPRAASAVGIGHPGRGQAVDRLRCVKHERRLYAYLGDKAVMSFNVALGREPRGHKVQEGDGRTPEGLYHIVAARPDSDYYLSLKISYPNADDRARARALGVPPGGQIMIHGLDPAIDRNWHDRHWMFNWTNGCIAVTNPEMKVLWDSVALGTPIEILA
jgi:murein L,D-transpeptidase YafK